MLDAWTIIAGNSVALGVVLFFNWWRLDRNEKATEKLELNLQTSISSLEESNTKEHDDLEAKFDGIVGDLNKHRLNAKIHTPLERLVRLEDRVNIKLNGASK